MLLMKRFFLIVFVSSSFGVMAEEVLILGGGDHPDNSQVSIELNVEWIASLARSSKDNKNVSVYYTDAHNSTPDVKEELSILDKEMIAFEPLSRVYDDRNKFKEVFRNHSVNDVIGGTKVKFIKSELLNKIRNMPVGASMMIIYQGHGGRDHSDRNNNYLKLWGRTGLTVKELDDLFLNAHDKSTLRFVFPQCYSGAFSRLMYKELDKNKRLSDGMRCGFLAQAHNKKSEGCTSSVNTSDYRDYSNYFFSALSGKTRLGAQLTHNPDSNSDGVISLREAHFYTLATAHSTDFSRSTSDQYLEDWQPWYVRWLPNLTTKNEYSVAAGILIDRIANGDVSVVNSNIDNLGEKIEKQEKKYDHTKELIKKNQKTLRQKLSLQWPGISAPYTDRYNKIITKSLEDINRFLSSSTVYSELKDAQNNRDQIKQNILNLRRDRVQYLKYLRLKKLSSLKRYFTIMASANAKDEYDRLVECEEVGFLQ